MTRRQEIIAVLQNRKLTLHELADEFLATEEEIEIDLREIASAVKPQMSLEQTAPVCRKCGFVFKTRRDKNKVRPPGRCPQCRDEDIAPPGYFIETHKDNIKKGLR